MDFAPFLNVIVVVILLLVATLVVALGTAQGTEVVKLVLRGLKELPWAAFDKIPTGSAASWFAALMVALALTYGFNINLLSQIPYFQGIDPKMVQFLSAVVTWATSTIIHTSGLLPAPKGKVIDDKVPRTSR